MLTAAGAQRHVLRTKRGLEHEQIEVDLGSRRREHRHGVRRHRIGLADVVVLGDRDRRRRGKRSRWPRGPGGTWRRRSFHDPVRLGLGHRRPRTAKRDGCRWITGPQSGCDRRYGIIASSALRHREPFPRGLGWAVACFASVVLDRQLTCSLGATSLGGNRLRVGVTYVSYRTYRPHPGRRSLGPDLGARLGLSTTVFRNFHRGAISRVPRYCTHTTRCRQLRWHVYSGYYRGTGELLQAEAP